MHGRHFLQGDKGGPYNNRLPFPSSLATADVDTTAQDIFSLIGRSGQIDMAAHAMKAIAHPLRLKILCVLGEQEVSVQEIVEAVGTSQSNVSQHLAILRDKGIVGWRKDRNRVYYRVADGRTLNLIGMVREVYCADEQVSADIRPPDPVS